jgi:VWFA-related protein
VKIERRKEIMRTKRLGDWATGRLGDRGNFSPRLPVSPSPRRFLSLSLFLFLSLSLTAFAQSGRKPQGKQEQGDKPFARIETREVAVPIIAYDPEGNYVNDLKPKDVLVLEEGEARQVTNLKRDPANIVLILDLANEIGTFKNGPTERYGKPDAPIWEKGANYKVIRRPTQWEFANQFISGLSPSDKIAIIQYSEKAQLIQDWTGDRDQAARAINSKYRVGLKSSYYDSLKLAADKLQSRSEGRRIVVLISDGLDSSSKITRSKAIQALEKARATVFVVGWADALRHEVELSIGWINNHEAGGPSAYKRVTELRQYILQLEGAATELRQLAENSGGELLLPPTHEDLIKANKNVNAEIGAQYTLSFLTDNAPSLEDKRSIEVLPARAGLTVRSRRSFLLGAEDEKVKSER